MRRSAAGRGSSSEPVPASVEAPAVLRGGSWDPTYICQPVTITTTISIPLWQMRPHCRRLYEFGEEVATDGGALRCHPIQSEYVGNGKARAGQARANLPEQQCSLWACSRRLHMNPLPTAWPITVQFGTLHAPAERNGTTPKNILVRAASDHFMQSDEMPCNMD